SSPYGNGQGYGHAPSAPPAPTPSSSSPYGYGYGHGQGGYPPPMGGGFGGAVAFPPGTHPDVERAFRAADRDGSGSIDEGELQAALSDAHHRFSIRTVRLLMFLFSDAQLASSPRSRMGKQSTRLYTHNKICISFGPTEFVTLWNCLGQWRVVFDRYDRDRSGKIDSDELREALRGLGYAVPPSVIDLLIANYNNGVSHRGALDFDNFVECGMVVKGLTEKFKENDTRYTGSAALTYDGFLSMVVPFIVP
uniref:EF-hand domain-containing protein n=1 Tax=Aegilops tauschii subsp. strangulata TaxID=200361 RepID=A0A453QUZ6_AEGTS